MEKDPKLPNPTFLLLAFSGYIIVGFFLAAFLNYSMGAN